MVLCTAVSFWLLAKEKLSLLKKKKKKAAEGEGDSDTGNQALLTKSGKNKNLCSGKSHVEVCHSHMIPWRQRIRGKRGNEGMTSIGTISHK